MEDNRGTDPDLGNMSPDNGTRSGESLRERIGERARKMRDSAASRADDAKGSIGRGVEHAGHTVRDRVSGEGRMHHAADKVASRVESVGRYLQEADFEEIAHDLTNVVRRYPL